jgi:hypothetical protein
MSYKRRDHIFFYNGNAVALGGYVESDGARIPFESVAPTVVSIVGGSSHARHKDYCFPEKRGVFKKHSDFFIEVKHAESETWGTERAGRYITFARSRLEGLNINDVVKADVVEAVLESSHPIQRGGEADIRVATEERESRIEGLKVANVKVETKLNRNLTQYTTFASLNGFIAQPQQAAASDRNAVAARQSFCRMSLMEPPGKDAPEYVADLCSFQRPDLIRCTIFESITASKDLDVYGYSIDVPKFGRVFLGELVVTNGQKRLNMIRFDLGCDTSGGGVGGGASVDGEPVP